MQDPNLLHQMEYLSQELENANQEIAKLNNQLKSQKWRAKKEKQIIEADLRAIRKSTSYRLGNHIVKLVKNPLLIFSYTKKLFLRGIKLILRIKKINGVSVIIPTYQKNPYIEEAVASILKQSYKKCEIILSVNGSDEAYFHYLETKYLSKKIKVIYTPKGGPAAARNYAVPFAKKDFITFLDDDDYYTEHFIEELVSLCNPEVNMVFGRMFDVYEDGRIDKEGYVVKSLPLEKKHLLTKDYLKYKNVFTNPCAKIFRRKFYIKNFVVFDESQKHTEDIIFWADNFKNITGYLGCASRKGEEAYLRRVLDNSRSRPEEKAKFQFWINDRIEVIDSLAKRMFDSNFPLKAKMFLMFLINAQTINMYRYYETLEDAKKEEAYQIIEQSNNFFLKKSHFAKKQGVAFCHNFAPYQDPSAYVAAKRLNQICEMEGTAIKWEVVYAGMDNARGIDMVYSQIYADYVIYHRTKIDGPAYLNEKAQYQFGLAAFEAVENLKAEVIYSRSMFPGSHVAAYLYKQKYPNVKWYAEFSDPLAKNANNTDRQLVNVNIGKNADILNDFWNYCEQIVYEHADKIIYTNKNQLAYMLGYNKHPELNDEIEKKALVMQHPAISADFCNIYPSAYKMDSKKVNIGYFGSFYPNRSNEGMLTMAQNPNVRLHFFVPKPSDMKEHQGSGNILVSKQKSYFEFLNVASKLDYLYLNDIDFDGPINPYLPSKITDYLLTGTKVIAVINDGSILSEMEHPNLIKIHEVTPEFIQSLKKE